MTATGRPSILRRYLVVSLALALSAVMVAPMPAWAADKDARIDALVEGLGAWAYALDRSGELGAFGETIPLTVATPGALAGLDGDVVQLTLAAALTGGTTDESMQQFLDALHGTHFDDVDGLTASFAVSEEDGVGDERASLSFDLDVQITRLIDVPLFHDENMAALDPELAGGLPTLSLRQGRIEQVKAVAQGTFKFALNVQQAEDPDFDVRSFEIRDPAGAKLTVDISIDGGIDPFVARYGITDTLATATSQDLTIQVTADLIDPAASGTGTITLQELTGTNPLDLYGIAASGSMDLALELTQPDLLTPRIGFGPADERITLTANGTVSAPPLPAFPAVVEVIGDRLAPFGTLTPDDVLVGLGEAALAMRAASNAADPNAPLLLGAVQNAVDPGGKLLDFVRDRAEVLILCGSTNTAPPEGIARDGGIAYCQAFANQEVAPNSVDWHLAGDTDDNFEVPAAADGTFGVDPQATIRVSTDRIPDLTVSWDIPVADRTPGEPFSRQGAPRFQTIQQLAIDLARAGYVDVDPADAVADLLAIAEVAGIGDTNDPVDVVTVNLSTSIDEPVDVDWGVSDALRPGARLSSVRTGGSPPTATVTPDGALNLTLGIVLDPTLPAPTAEPEVASQELIEKLRGRFLVTDGDANLIEVDTLAATDSQTMIGRIGFLPVEVDLDLTFGPGGDVLTVGIDPTTVLAPDPTGMTIQRPTGDGGWVRVADLIPYLDPYADPSNGESPAIPPRRGFDVTIDWEASVGVTVSDRMGLSDHSMGFGLSESFSATWTANATAPASEPDKPLRTRVPGLTITDNAAFASYSAALRPFDIAPEVRGVATGGNATTLEADLDFTAAFGVPAGTHIDATLLRGDNLDNDAVDNGGSCRGFTVQTNSLVCDEPLPPRDRTEDDPEAAVLPAMQWTAGDQFLVDGDLDSLRRVTTRALRVGAGGLATTENHALRAALPLVDLRPADLVPLVALADVLDAFAAAVEDDLGETHFDSQTPGEPGDGNQGDGVVTAQATAANLAELVDALHETLVQQLVEVEGLAGSRTVGVGVDVATIDGVPHLVLDVEVTDTDRTIDVPIRLLTEEHGAIIEDDGQTVEVTWDATVTVAVGIPLADGEDPRDIVILHDTGVELSLSAHEPVIEDITVLIGGISVQAGAGNAIIAGEADESTAPTTTLVDEDGNFQSRGVRAGAEIRLYDGDEVLATCNVSAASGSIADDQLVCDAPLALVNPPQFTQGDNYEVIAGSTRTFNAPEPDPDVTVNEGDVLASGTVGNYSDTAADGLDPTRDLYDPVTNFWSFPDVESVQAGDIVHLLEGGAGSDTTATCTVASISGGSGAFPVHTIVHCQDPLVPIDGAPQFDEDDPYEVDVVGVGSLGLEIEVELRHPVSGDASAPDVFFSEIVGTWTGTDSEACDEGDLTACLELSVRAEDDGRMIALGTLEYELDDSFLLSATGSDGTATFSPGVPFAVLPQSVIDGLDLRPLDLFNVATAGRFLEDLFADAFDGRLTQTSIPLVGTNLDAGVGRAPTEFAPGGVARVFADLERGLQGDLAGQAAAGSLGETLEDASLSAPFDDAIEAHIETYLGGFLGIVEGNYLDEGTSPLQITATVEVDCPGACDVLASVTDIRIEFSFAVGSAGAGVIGCDATCATGHRVAFDPGIPGLPLSQPLATDDRPTPIEVGHRWALDLAIGTSKSHGPYIAPHGGGGTADLHLGLFGQFADMETNPDCTNPDDILGPGASATQYAQTIGFPLGDNPRCGEALIGILPGRVYDGDGTSDETRRSAVEAAVTVTAANGVVGFGELLDQRRAPVDVSYRGRMNVLFESNAGDLYAAVFGGPEVGAMPAVVGTFHAFANTHDANVDPLYYFQVLAFDPLPFLREFLGPIANTIKDLTDPFGVLLETVSTEIPVVSELSQLTGGGPVTMLSLLESVSGNNLEMLARLIEAVKFANEIAGILDEDLVGFVPLGTVKEQDLSSINLNGGGANGEDEWELDVPWGTLDPTIQGGGFFVKIVDDGPGLPQAGKRDSDDLSAEKDASKPENKSGKKEPTELFKKKIEEDGKKLEAKATWSGATLTTPILDDPDEVHGMLLGKDAVLVRFDAGVLKAGFDVSWTFGPFAAGPVLFDIGIGLSIGLEGRFALGFDTYGFSRVVRTGSSFISPFVDGLYLDGYDANGKNVEEVKLVTSIKGSAAVSIYIFRAGLELEVRLTISLDLIDPRGDGRVRIEDIYRFRHDPICLFIVKGKLGFAVSVFLEINLIIKKVKKSWTIWELKPELDLFEIRCDPPEPVFGKLTNDVPGATAGWLPPGSWDQAFQLHVGALASQRALFPDETEEHFIVRQRSALNGVDISSDRRTHLSNIGIKNTADLGSATEGTIIEIEAFGETRLYALPKGTVLHAHSGDGEDTILLEPGTELPIPTGDEPTGNGNGDDEETFDFLIPAWIEASGADRNRFDGGDGGNVLIGANGNDTLKGGRGNDIIFGIEGNNKINGSRGDNVLIGGIGDDRISGGPGSDVIVGGIGNDTIEAGPGLRPGTEPQGQRDLVDTGSILVGGGGDNSISGGPSTDYILAGGWPLNALEASDMPSGANAGNVNNLLRNPPLTSASAATRVNEAAQARQWALHLLGPAATRGQSLNRAFAGRLCRLADSVLGSGNNVVDGARGHDLVIGGKGNDQLKGGRGDDILCVPAGDNVLEGTTGNNELHGGAGNDRLIGGPGHDWITGGGGENYLEAGEGRNLLIGGTGADVLAGGQQGELLIADGGPSSGAGGIYLRDGVSGFVRVTVDGASDPLTLGDWAPLVGNGAPPNPFAFTVTGLYAEEDGGEPSGFKQEDGHLTACRPTAQVLSNGRLDLEGNGTSTTRGRFQGYAVQSGLVKDVAGNNLNGVVAGMAVHNGLVDLNGNGSGGPAGRLDGAAIGYVGTAARANCVLGGNAPNAIFGGPAADHIHAGMGNDFVDAGPGENLVRGGPGNTVLFGGPHDNTIFGDSGHDAIFGGPGNDELDGGQGNDYIEGNQGNDLIRGGAGDDVLIGGSSGTAVDIYAAASPGNTVARAWWDTNLSSPSGNDVLFGETGDDLVVGDNLRIEEDGRLSWWEPGDEAAWLTAATTALADCGVHPGTGPAFGGCDRLHGGTGENVLIGGLGDDVLHAGQDHSYLFGDLTWLWPTSDALSTWLGGQPAWHGVLFGGVAAPPWWAVVQEGSSAEDPPYQIAPSDPGGATHWPGGAARYDVLLAAPNVGGNDHVVGSPGDDHIFGGAGNDVLEGGKGQDYIEGGPGNDRLYAESEAMALALTTPEMLGSSLEATIMSIFGPRSGLLITAFGAASPGNDLIGGSSSVHPDAADPDGPGAPSGHDIVVGADHEDVLMGDNAQIRRLVDGATAGNSGTWRVDPITGGRARDVEPYDLHRLDDDYEIDPSATGSGALGTYEPTTRSGEGGLDGETTLGGDDVIVGIDGRNRMYGGPGDDYIRGGPTDDYAEGGPGNDWIEGGGGDDDLIGGSSFAADNSSRALDTGSTDLGTEGFPSGTNVILGQGGQNVLTGDNARVLRASPDDPATVGAEDFDTYLATEGRFIGFTTPRWISLMDLDDPMEATIGGDDLLSAGPGNSLVFGQGGDDWGSGGAGSDYVEGNAGNDVLLGDRQFGITPDGDEATATDIAADDLLAERPTIARRDHTLNSFRWPATQRDLDRYRNTRVNNTGPTAVPLLEGLPSEIAAIGDGQDDLIGGNSRAALPAGDDTIYGDGADDVILGDNAAVIRAVDGDVYRHYDERYDPDYAGPRTIVRQVIEFDVGASLDCGPTATWACTDPAKPWGDDFLDGGTGDDTLHGQDGDDELWGSPQHDQIGARGESWGDHVIGGLGDDRLFGGPGHDVLIGDRGAIISIYITDDTERVAYTANGPPFINFAGLETGDLWHRVDLYCKEDRSPVADGGLPRFFDHDGDGCQLGGSDGLGDPSAEADVAALVGIRYSHWTHGGDDLLRGGRGDTTMYGGGGNDMLNGDIGADILFGGRGSNILYGGEGEEGVFSTNPNTYQRDNDRDHVDWLFGGRGESLLDYRPRVQPGQNLSAGWLNPAARQDPGLWFQMTRPYWHPDDVDDATFEELRNTLHGDLTSILNEDGTAAAGLADTAMTVNPQHHQGVTWAWGGWGRKVHQSSVSANGPNPGDRNIDYIGNFNLFTHCASHYGSWNFSREIRPQTDDVVHRLALIAGAGPSEAALRRPGTSGFDQIAYIHPRIDDSISENTGAAFRDTQLNWGGDLPGMDTIPEGVGGTPGHRYDTNIACGTG